MENRRACLGFAFLAHAVPGIGVYGVGVAHRLFGVAKQLDRVSDGAAVKVEQK